MTVPRPRNSPPPRRRGAEDRHAVGCITGMSLAENLSLKPGSTRFSDMACSTAPRCGARRGTDGALRVRALAGCRLRRTVRRQPAEAVLAREISTDGLRVPAGPRRPRAGWTWVRWKRCTRQIRAACRRGAGVLLISSELDELIDVADRILVLYGAAWMGHCPAEPAQRERIGAMMAGQQDERVGFDVQFLKRPALWVSVAAGAGGQPVRQWRWWS